MSPPARRLVLPERIEAEVGEVRALAGSGKELAGGRRVGGFIGPIFPMVEDDVRAAAEEFLGKPQDRVHATFRDAVEKDDAIGEAVVGSVNVLVEDLFVVLEFLFYGSSCVGRCQRLR